MASLLVMMSEAWGASVVKIAMPRATASGLPLADTFVNTGRLHSIRSALVRISKTAHCPSPVLVVLEARCPIFWIDSRFLQSLVG